MTRRKLVIWSLTLATLTLAGTADASAADAPGLAVKATGIHAFERGFVILHGGHVRLRSVVTGAPTGSVLVVHAVQGGHDRALRRHRLTGSTATFGDVVRPGSHGLLTVRMVLSGPDGRALVRRSPLRVSVLAPTAHPGDRGTRVRFLQRSLAALRYAIAVTGRFDGATARAVIAFRKVNRMRRVGVASAKVFSLAARGAGAFHPRHRGAAHVEGDLTRQVLALVAPGGRVFKIYMTSSGRPSLRTPTGVHRFWRKERGWNSEGMLDSSYFTHASGPRTDCAIHGYPDVPTWNASHCCFRVPIPDARKIFNRVRIGERIYVYY